MSNPYYNNQPYNYGSSNNQYYQQDQQQQYYQQDQQSSYYNQQDNSYYNQQSSSNYDQNQPPAGYDNQNASGYSDRRDDRDRKSRDDRSSKRSSRDDRDRHDRKDRERDRDRGRDKDRDHRRRSRSRSREKKEKESAVPNDSSTKDLRPRDPPRLRKRPSLWDVAPTGFETGTVQIPTQIAPQASVNPLANRQAKRVYVGNIPAGIKEMEIAEFFNTAMYTAGVTKDSNSNPVVAVQMNHEKAFAFLEFKEWEDANAAMGFDGITLQGNALKVRRPKDYKTGNEVVFEDPNASGGKQLPNIVSTNVGEGPNKIFVGGLPAYLNEEQVKQLISTFGPLKSFNLVKDPQTGNSKGFAFYEYVDPNVTDRACQGLNGMKIGEKTILVQRATLGAKHSNMPAPNPNAQSILTNPTAFNFLNLGMPIAAAAALLGMNINDPGPSSKILCIINMVSPEELLIDEEYQDIIDDIIHEMKRFGTIVTIEVPKPPPPKPESDDLNMVSTNTLPTEVYWGVGKVFIEYKSKEEAKKAQSATAGRKFNGRTCITGYYPEDKFYKKIWTPDPEEEKRVADKFRKQKEETDQIEIERARREVLEDIAEMEMLEQMNREADLREQREREQREKQLNN